ncbi:hypothetical protein ACRAWD_26680 [Caulobacter segnis]
MTDYIADEPSSITGTAASRMRPKLDAAAVSAHEAYDSLKDVATAAVGETRERVTNIASQAAERAERRYEDLQAWVQLRPTQALGVAAGLGVVLGLLLRGRSTKTVYLRDHR